MAVPLTVRSAGGPWDVILSFGNRSMGFVARAPAQQTQISNVVPRVRIGSDPGFTEGPLDVIAFPSFSTGGDLERLEAGEERYQWSDGNVALYVDKRVTLASRWEIVDADITPTFFRILDFVTANGDYWCIAEGDHLRIYDDSGGTYSDEEPAAGIAADIVHMFSNDQYLFCACGTGDDAWRWDGDPTTGWSELTGFKADAFGWYKETLYRGLGNELIPATDNDGTAWGTAFHVGWDSTDIEDLYEASGYLFIAKKEGLYVYDGTDVYLLIDAYETRATGNFVGGKYWQGALYTPWLSSIYKSVIASVKSSTVSDITPHMLGSEAKERYGHGAPKVIFAGPKKLYIALDNGEGQYPELLSYNGVGFHQVYRGTSGDTLYAAGHSALKGWVLINDGSTRRKRIVNTGLGEYADYAPSGEFYTPIVDAGYPDETKAWVQVEFEAKGCDATHTVAAYYRQDGGAWTAMDTISEDGKHQVLFDEAEGQINSREMELRFVLGAPPGDGDTPRIKLPIGVRCLVTAGAVDAYSEVLELSENQQLRNGYGTVGDDAGYTEGAMREFLNQCRQTAETIIRIDEFGHRTNVKMTDRVLQTEADRSTNEQKSVASLRWLELFSGIKSQYQMSTQATLSLTTSALIADYLADGASAVLVDGAGAIALDGAM